MLLLIGLGAGDAETLSPAATAALREAAAAGRLFLRTARHPSVGWLVRDGIAYDAFDDVYEQEPSFEAVYAHISDTVLRAAEAVGPDGIVGYAVPGDPLLGEETTARILAQAPEMSVEVRTVRSTGFVDAVLAAAQIPAPNGLDVRDAHGLSAEPTVGPAGEPMAAPLDPSRPLLLFQVHSRNVASAAKLAVMRAWPDDWPVVVVRSALVQGHESVVRVPLHALDRTEFDHLASVVVPALPPNMRRPAFGDLVGIMARLRGPAGCPWDREQTPATLRRYLVEETYEVVDAIDAGDVDHLCEELGDLLLQVVFHAQLAREAGDFDIDDVCAGIVEKLVRRHPHVFGTVSVADSDEVLVNWERIKKAEKPDAPARTLDGVSRSLPALALASELGRKAARVGFDWPDADAVAGKLAEEMAELDSELTAEQPDEVRIGEELGDLLFGAAQLARWRQLDAETLLRDAANRFRSRFEHMEDAAIAGGTTLAALGPDKLDALWDAAKAARRDT